MLSSNDETSKTINVAENASDEVKAHDPYEVTLETKDNPQCLSSFRKWAIVAFISSAALCVSCASSVASFTEAGVSRDFRVSKEVTILGISLFVEGLGCGPLLVGPLSEVYGRNDVYYISFALLFAFSWPVAFAPNIAVYLTFRFITGFCGSAFLSVAGGSVSDLFANENVANPMAFYTLFPFIGPVLGPLISGFINQNVDWRWTYRVQLIWVFVELLGVLLIVPETYVPVILQRKAKRLRKTTGDSRYYSPLDKRHKNLVSAIFTSCYKPFQLMLYDRMALLLNTWNALLLGILYLAFQAYPVIFEDGHGFNMEDTGLTFLGIGLGMLLGISTEPYWHWKFAREAAKCKGPPPPEICLFMGQAGACLAPIGLFCMAATIYPKVPWIMPIIASIPFGAGIYLVFTSTFTYLVTAYRPIAASAMASNSFLRLTFAAVFPLFAGALYSRLGAIGATALMAGLTLVMAPFPFIFRRIGHRLRANSQFA